MINSSEASSSFVCILQHGHCGLRFEVEIQKAKVLVRDHRDRSRGPGDCKRRPSERTPRLRASLNPSRSISACIDSVTASRPVPVGAPNSVAQNRFGRVAVCNHCVVHRPHSIERVPVSSQRVRGQCRVGVRMHSDNVEVLSSSIFVDVREERRGAYVSAVVSCGGQATGDNCCARLHCLDCYARCGEQLRVILRIRRRIEECLEIGLVPDSPMTKWNSSSGQRQAPRTYRTRPGLAGRVCVSGLVAAGSLAQAGV